MGHISGANFTRIKQRIALVVSNDHRIEGIAGRVTADDKLLTLVDLIFDPGAAALSRFVKRILPLGDNTLESKFRDSPDHVIEASVHGFR
jgi:hypothetical protein